MSFCVSKGVGFLFWNTFILWCWLKGTEPSGAHGGWFATLRLSMLKALSLFTGDPFSLLNVASCFLKALNKAVLGKFQEATLDQQNPIEATYNPQAPECFEPLQICNPCTHETADATQTNKHASTTSKVSKQTQRNRTTQTRYSHQHWQWKISFRP